MDVTDLRDEREFNEEEYKNDIECKMELLKYNKHFIMDMKETKGIDVILYYEIKGKLEKVGFLELEKNRWNATNEEKFYFPTLLHKKKKVDKYIEIEKGQNGEWLPSFYIHFTKDMKYITITKFADITRKKITVKYVPYRMVGYEEDLSKTIFCKVKDWEKVIMFLIHGIFPYHLDLNRK